MGKLAEKAARDLIIMITAGGIDKLPEVLDMAKLYQVRATHIQQLALPEDEIPASKILIKALRSNGIY